MTEVRALFALIVGLGAAFAAATGSVSAQETHFAPAFASNSTATSFVRVYNAAATAGSFTVALRTENSSNVIATWTGEIAPHATAAVKMSDIEARGQVTPPADGRTYSVAVSATIEGFAQHVVFKNADRSWMNFSTCGGASGDTKTLINVHDQSQVSASVIVLHNTGAANAAATISIIDAGTGATIGVWTSPTIAAGATAAPIAASQIIAEARLPDGQRPYVTFILNEAFTGYAQHLVSAVGTANVSDMTAKCALSTPSAGA